MKTCLIIALYCISSRYLVSEYPSLKRVFGRFLPKRPWRQTEDAVRICLSKAVFAPGKSMTAKFSEADGYVDNSPLRSELTTYPQPQQPEKGKEETRLKEISMWIIHKPPPSDLGSGDPPGGSVWITPRKNDGNWIKVGRVNGKEPLTQSCHFVISVEEEIG